MRCASRAAQLTRPALATASKTVRWFVIVGLLLAVVLGGLYGFNRFRAQAIATFFANNKPPPAQIAAVTAESRAGAALRHRHRLARRRAPGHGHARSRRPGDRDLLRARARRSKPATRWCSSTTRPSAATSPISRRRRAWRALSLAALERSWHTAIRPRETVDQNQMPLDQARAHIVKTQALIAQKLIRAPFAGRLGIRQVELGQYVTPARRS